MITSFAIIQEVVKNATLEKQSIVACHFLQDEDNKLNPENFAFSILNKKNNPPAWLAKDFIKIVRLFGSRGAYGSIMGLIKFYTDNYENAVTKIIEKIQNDQKQASPTLKELDLNFLLIAAMFCDLKPLMVFLLNQCKININYQTPDFHMTAASYGVKYASHDCFQSLLAHGRHTKSLDFSLQSNGGNILNRAINSLNFTPTRHATKQEKISELIYLLECHTSLMLGEDNSAFNEAVKFATSEAYIFLRYGAGLVKPEYRVLPQNKELGSSFDREKYQQANAVLVAINEDDGIPLWLYGTAEIKQALTNRSLDICHTQIIKQLNQANPAVLADGVLQLFMPLPTRILTVTQEMATEENEASDGVVSRSELSDSSVDSAVMRQRRQSALEDLFPLTNIDLDSEPDSNNSYGFEHIEVASDNVSVYANDFEQIEAYDDSDNTAFVTNEAETGATQSTTANKCVIC